MALARDLPIYKVAYDLTGVATGFVQNMPRPVKAVIGGRLRDLCLELVLLIFRANCSGDKVPHLLQLRERLEEAEILLRLCRDKHFISTKQYARAIELTTSVGRQGTRWRQSYGTSPAI